MDALRVPRETFARIVPRWREMLDCVRDPRGCMTSAIPRPPLQSAGMERPRPQAREMADESMVRNLAAQAEAIWPQEEPIFDRHPLADGAVVLDVGCGTGEITARLAEKFPRAAFVGIDLEEPHLERARRLCERFGARVRFEAGDALELPFGDDSFDLVVCRHLLQAVPDARQVLREIRRVLCPGGRVHLISEDYGMLHCYPTELEADDFWQRIPWQYEAAAGCDLHIGRKTFTLLHDLAMHDIRCDYVVVDTLRVPRETFARIWEAWRDGYTDTMAEHTGIPRDEIVRRWREMIDCVRDPRGYALWQVPVWTAGK
ncbi:MAG TPA: methyltransferase domain-containing protein [Thermoanaerobaculia bacterium]|nr:methyltransferase domain-containing protein [Thermoanaerobaculia bacterium]